MIKRAATKQLWGERQFTDRRILKGPSAGSVKWFSTVLTGCSLLSHINSSPGKQEHQELQWTIFFFFTCQFLISLIFKRHFSVNRNSRVFFKISDMLYKQTWNITVIEKQTNRTLSQEAALRVPFVNVNFIFVTLYHVVTLHCYITMLRCYDTLLRYFVMLLCNVTL